VAVGVDHRGDADGVLLMAVVYIRATTSKRELCRRQRNHAGILRRLRPVIVHFADRSCIFSMMPNEAATVIGRSMKVRGEFSGTDDLLVDGEIDGVIRLPASRLTIRAEGIVRAAVLAKEVVVLGRLEGEVRATVVVGDVFAGRLSMEDGAVLRGNVDPARANEGLTQGAGTHESSQA
jgi:cytoskeletal protein CcmA (bactofilin family)